MRKTEEVTFTNMCMVTDGNRVLVQERRDKGWPGVAFPGGHVEKGESFTEAVIREVWEETGLTITSPRLCGVKDLCDGNGRYVVLLYRADSFTGEIHSSEEGKVWWADIGELNAMNLASSMAETLRVFMEEDKSEHFFRREGENWIAEIK